MPMFLCSLEIPVSVWEHPDRTHNDAFTYTWSVSFHSLLHDSSIIFLKCVCDLVY